MAEYFDKFKNDVYRKHNIVIVDDTPDTEPQPLLLTRYTLDKMDESWNKILESDH